ncbi:coiled-coil domain-containing protein 18-like [Hydra vulgaris]|uniref:Coiled-coil domain-containing protein 172 n=1 Tax=Hydra vulgaris TaxID=6087 RepID=A0ABM4BW16_HYDVU
MSAQVINELFQQIIDSEEKIKERFQTLKKLNQTIEDQQLMLKQTKRKTEVLFATLSATSQRCIQEEIELNWLRARENILLEQKKSSLIEKNDLAEKVKVLESATAEESLEFLSSCDKFLKEFELMNEKKSSFEETMKADHIKLTEENNKLLEIIQAQKVKNEKSTKEKNELYEALKQVHIKKKDLLKESSEYEDEISQLMCLKSTLTSNNENIELQCILKEINKTNEEYCYLAEHRQQLSSPCFQRQQCKKNRDSNIILKTQAAKENSQELKKTRLFSLCGSSSLVQPSKKNRFNYLKPLKENSSKFMSSKWRASASFPSALDEDLFCLEVSDQESFMDVVSNGISDDDKIISNTRDQ